MGSKFWFAGFKAARGKRLLDLTMLAQDCCGADSFVGAISACSRVIGEALSLCEEASIGLMRLREASCDRERAAREAELVVSQMVELYGAERVINGDVEEFEGPDAMREHLRKMVWMLFDRSVSGIGLEEGITRIASSSAAIMLSIMKGAVLEFNRAERLALQCSAVRGDMLPLLKPKVIRKGKVVVSQSDRALKVNIGGSYSVFSTSSSSLSDLNVVLSEINNGSMDGVMPEMELGMFKSMIEDVIEFRKHDCMDCSLRISIKKEGNGFAANSHFKSELVDSVQIDGIGMFGYKRECSGAGVGDPFAGKRNLFLVFGSLLSSEVPSRESEIYMKVSDESIEIGFLKSSKCLRFSFEPLGLISFRVPSEHVSAIAGLNPWLLHFAAKSMKQVNSEIESRCVKLIRSFERSALFSVSRI